MAAPAPQKNFKKRSLARAAAAMELELNSVMVRPNSKGWNLIKLDRPSKKARDVAEFEAMLRDSLKPLFKTVIRVTDYEGALWAQIDVLGLSARYAKQSCFMVHYPHTLFVFFSAPGGKLLADSIESALKVAFACHSLRMVNCSGTDFDVLTDLALYPLSQGLYGSYRLYGDLLDTHPLGGDDEDKRAVAQRRRIRVQDRNDSRAEILQELGYEDAIWGNVRNRETGGVTVPEERLEKLRAVGSGALSREQRAQQPTGTQKVSLVRLEISAPLSWGPKNEPLPFRCSVELQGTSVMNGIRELARHGLVQDRVTNALSDASTVIQDALESKIENKRGRPKNARKANEAEPDAPAYVRAVKVVVM